MNLHAPGFQWARRTNALGTFCNFLSQYRATLTLLVMCGIASVAVAQPPQFGGRGGQDGAGGPGGFRPGGFGPGGPGGSREDRKLVEKFDVDENGWLNEEERAKARKAAKSEGGERRRGGFGPPGGGRGRGRDNREPGRPGRRVSPEDVQQYPTAELYEAGVLRTLFFEFENDDWESELEDFHGTDVEVPAQMLVDGKTYENVGVRFRGQSSYGMVPTGSKRSFNVSIDLANDDQRLYGSKTLNLLNCAGDPSLMSTVLYSHIASQYIPVPKANHVHVVVNGESWGVYANVQQFNKDFLKEHYESSKGTRWKVSGNPGADGGLRYLGEDVEPYEQRFDMKSSDGKKAWAALIKLCRTLNETPLDRLEDELAPMLDIDEALKFLALDVALVNGDGYWTRASDYSIFLDSDKQFHLIPHDMNEAFTMGHGGGGPGGGPGGPRRGPGDAGPGSGPPPFGFGPPPGDGFGPPPGGFGPGGEEFDRRDNRQPRGEDRGRFERDGDRRGRGDQGDRRRGDEPPRGDERGRFEGRGRGRGGFGGPGGPGGPGHGGVDLDPLVSIDNPRMPLRSRLLAVPELRARYMHYVREIAENSLAWDKIGPVLDQHTRLIEKEVASDTRKLESTEAFRQATSAAPVRGESGHQSLRSFFEQRQEYLLNYPDKAAATF